MRKWYNSPTSSYLTPGCLGLKKCFPQNHLSVCLEKVFFGGKHSGDCFLIRMKLWQNWVTYSFDSILAL